LEALQAELQRSSNSCRLCRTAAAVKEELPGMKDIRYWTSAKCLTPNSRTPEEAEAEAL
jgi:hypothetical protein